MANMSFEKVKMPEQDPSTRAGNFKEVSLGYTAEMAVEEAKRCLNCKNKPCIDGCPVNVDIPTFIAEVAEKNFEKAYKIITKTNSLPAVCGRVCPQEVQCEGKCVRGIKNEPVAIGRLERFVADSQLSKVSEKTKTFSIKTNGKKVAVIGAGPSGLTCAGDLAKNGFAVTIFESLQVAGGVLMYGIPEFRLPKAIVQKEIHNLCKLGVTIQTNVIVGKSITIDELFADGYSAVFIGTGAGLPSFMNIKGESLGGVFSANEYLTRINLMKAQKPNYDTPIFESKDVVVVGGGNVAMDAARCALRTGANVKIIYRRSEEEMPARKEEIHHAKEEGIEFLTLNNPTEIIGDNSGFVKAINCVKMELGEPDLSGRRSPIVVQNSEYTLECDTVIMAIGTSPNPLLRNTTNGLEVNKRGCLVVDEYLETTRKNVYAGGDAVTGAATVILAMGAGRKSALRISELIGVG
ncbi:oxidoreductase [Clostridia bacterium]|nr:oxidoreductase [Clostridia bacterium]